MRRRILITLIIFILPVTLSAKSNKILSINLAWRSEGKIQVDSDSTNQPIKSYFITFTVHDDRIDKSCIGYTDTAISCDNVTEWITTALTSINSDTDRQSPVTQHIECVVHVKRISCTARQMSMRCSVLLDTEFYRNHNIILKKSYFGSTTESKSIIGSSTGFNEDKVMKGLNRALAVCLDKIIFDVEQIASTDK